MPDAVMSGGARVVSSATLAHIGDGIRQVALPLLVVSMTRHPIAVSGLTAVSFLPWVLLGLPIGAYVDQGRPLAVAVGANLGRAVLLGLLAVTLLVGFRSIALVYVVVFGLGVGEAAYDNAAQSLLPLVVSDAGLEKANGWLVTVEQVGQDLAGPAVGGLIFAASAALPFGLNAVGLLLGVALLAPTRTAARPVAARGVHVRQLLSQIPEGMRWLLRNRRVRVIIFAGTGLTFLVQLWQPLLVLLALGPMRVSQTGYGVMLALGSIAGIGGALATPMLIRRFSQRSLQVFALAATAAGVLALAAFPDPVVAALAWGDTGFTFALWNVLSVTLRQRLVPPELLGRVNSASRTFSTAAVPLGALAGGAVANAAGLRAPFWLSAIALAFLSLIFAGQTAWRRAEPQPAD
jgi:MFS family permease